VWAPVAPIPQPALASQGESGDGGPVAWRALVVAPPGAISSCAALQKFTDSKMLPTAGPTAAPSSTPPSATSDEPDDEQKHNRADGGVDDQVDSSDTEMDIKSRQQPVTDERADNPDYQVPDEAEPDAPHDLTSQPSGNNSN
jgi:hypothetical protein